MCLHITAPHPTDNNTVWKAWWDGKRMLHKTVANITEEHPFSIPPSFPYCIIIGCAPTPLFPHPICVKGSKENPKEANKA